MAAGAGNAGLGRARAAKNDEFYTQWADIEREMNAYLEFDPEVFRDKTVLLPCDDPEWSNFTKFFALHFMDFGLKKLISTSYAPDSNPAKVDYQPTLFESESPQFDATKSHANGKLLTLEAKDINGDGVIDIDDLQWEYMEGDGDFRSDEVIKLRDEADLVITNPPFSLFREFLAWLVEGDVKFAVICNKNSVTHKEVFPLIQENLIWLGRTPMATDMLFGVPEQLAAEMVAASKPGSKYRIVDGEVLGRAQACWLTNLDHGRRHERMQLMTMADNLRFNKKLIKSLNGHDHYERYSNYDAIEVPFTDAIPGDYTGVMGVPRSFLDKYNPDHFEIVGADSSAELLQAIGVRPLGADFIREYRAQGGTKHISAGGRDLGIAEPRHRTAYARILIRHRHPA